MVLVILYFFGLFLCDEILGSSRIDCSFDLKLIALALYFYSVNLLFIIFHIEL